MAKKIRVAIVAGSMSDINQAINDSKMTDVFDKVGVGWELSVISAHRHDEPLKQYCEDAIQKGVQVFIGVAGMAAALPGAIGAKIRFSYPVIGVPLSTSTFGAQDSLLSMLSMPSGCPILVCGADKSGLVNAAISACQILALTDVKIQNGLRNYIKEMAKLRTPSIRLFSSEDH